MTLEQIDQSLLQLSDSVERSGASLLEFDLDADRRLLDESSLKGETAARWAEAKALTMQLWQWQGLLEQRLEHARNLRRGRRPRPEQLAELTALLDGPSLELQSIDVPLAERTLLGKSQTTPRCTIAELLARMSRAFDEATAVVAAAGAAWQASIPRLTAARALLGECAQLADELGDRGRTDLETAQRRLAELADSLTRDPLSVDAAQLDELVRSIEPIHHDLDAVKELRGELASRLARARDLLAELRELALQGEAAHAETLSRIAQPDVPEPIEIDGDLDREIGRIAGLAARGNWPDACGALERWTATADTLVERARAIVAANRAPIEARNQLRALLVAYRAKAGGLALIEDRRLADIFTRAQDALYTAPTDLVHAAELVRTYQQALSNSPTTREVPR